MRVESVFKNTILSILFTLIIGALSFIVNRVFSEQLGQDSLGILRLFSQLVAYISLAELGVSAASMALLFKPISNREYDKVSSIVYTIGYFYSRVAVVIAFLGIIMNFFIKFIVLNVDMYIYICWNLYVFSVVLTYLYAKHPILLSADQRYGFVQLLRSVLKIASLSSQIIVVLYLKSFIAFVFCAIVFNIIEGVVYSVFYHYHYAKIIPLSKSKSLELIGKTKEVFIHKVAGVLVFNSDYIILSKFVGLSSVAVYSSYMMLLQFIQLFISNIVNVVTPKIGEFYVKESREAILLLWMRMFSVNCYVAAVIVVILYVNIIDFVILWMGSDYSISMITLILMLLNFFIELSRRSVEIIKSVSGYYSDTHLPIIEGGINIALSIFLVGSYGLDGVIIGTVASNTLVVLLLKPYMLFKNVFGGSFSIYIKSLVKYSFFLCVIISIVLNIPFSSNFLIKLLQSIIVVLVSATVIFSIDSSFRFSIKLFFLPLISRRFKN